MMNKDYPLDAFLSLIRGGLWEQSVTLARYPELDWRIILQLAKDQTVVGLLGAGLEHLSDVKVPVSVAKDCLGLVMGIEMRNRKMNGLLVSQARAFSVNHVTALVLKGQGVAQCYERPLWRQPGDIDWLTDGDGYERGKALLLQNADSPHMEYGDLKHYGMRFGDIEVELHGTTHTDLSRQIDYHLDEMQHQLFENLQFRHWDCSGLQILLPDPNFDAIFIFTHFVHHFYHGGVGLRQICDWTRFLHVFSDKLDRDYLKDHLEIMDLMTEWKAFGSLSVSFLGLDPSKMPFYEPGYETKAKRIVRYIVRTGAFGHKTGIRQPKYKNYLHRKLVAFIYRARDIIQVFRVFPPQSLKYLLAFGWEGMKKTFRRN